MIYELASEWNVLPAEIKKLPASEFYEMVDIHNLRAFTVKNNG